MTKGCPIFVMTNQEPRSQRSGPIALPPLKRYYRLDEVAVYFAISARTVYRLLDEGDLHVTRIRGCVRVSAEEIRRFEERLEETSPF
jgi:excisionase family DNA binding protein